MGTKRTLADCVEWAAKRGGLCLSAVYVNANTPLGWRCASGHEWQATPNHVRLGSWCMECRRPQVTIEKCREKARQRGGKCLSSSYINNTSSMAFRCALGHEWVSSWAVIERGGWCPKCGKKRAAESQKRTLSDCQDTATSRGGICLSSGYVSSMSSMAWRCSEGHEWSNHASAIFSGKWCPICSQIERTKHRHELLTQEAHSIAASRGGLCLSERYSGVKNKLLWKCGDCDHEWWASFNNTQRGRWCPECQVSKNEKTVRRWLENHFSLPFPKRRIVFEGKKFEIDCYNDTLRLGVEYDGEQHYLPIKCWGGENGLRGVRERDAFKEDACRKLGITLVRVPYTAKTNIPLFLSRAIS